MADADSLTLFLGVGRNGIPADREQLDEYENQDENAHNIPGIGEPFEVS